MRFRQVLAARALAFIEIRNSIQTEAVNAHVGPVIDGAEYGTADQRIIEIEIRLMRIETMPEVGLRQRVPGPIGSFEVLENNPGAAIFIGRVAPDVEIAPARPGGGAAGTLKPSVLVRSVVDDQLGDNAETSAVSLFHERLEIAQVSVCRMDVAEIGDVVSIVLPRRREERQQPDCRDA